MLGSVLLCDLVVFPLKYLFAVVATISFVVGISIMVLYYSRFHPNRRKPPLLKIFASKGVASLEADYVPANLKHVDSDDSLVIA